MGARNHLNSLGKAMLREGGIDELSDIVSKKSSEEEYRV